MSVLLTYSGKVKERKFNNLLTESLMTIRAVTKHDLQLCALGAVICKYKSVMDDE